MTETQNVLVALSKRLGDKDISIIKDRAKVENLEHQIALYQNSITDKKSEIEKKTLERDRISALLAEAETLVKRHAHLVKYTGSLVEKFNAIEWRPDLPFEDKLESTDYAEKINEKFEIEARLTAILKEANKTYFRR